MFKTLFSLLLSSAVVAAVSELFFRPLFRHARALRSSRRPLEPGAVVYVAGPFSAYRDALGVYRDIGDNMDAAERDGKAVRALGFVPFVPHLAIPNPGPGRRGWLIAMRECLVHLANTRATVLMKDWDRSEGARVEEKATIEAGRRVFYSVKELADQVESWKRADPAYALRLEAYVRAAVEPLGEGVAA